MCVCVCVCVGEGYTVALWVNFADVADRRPHVYMSNGGHSGSGGHGVAMTYDGGELEMRFRDRDGREWAARSDDVLPSRWYHVAATWNAVDGLSLYINGDLADRDQLPQPRPGTDAAGGSPRSDEFLIGKANDETTVSERHPLAVDDFDFWSEHKDASSIKQLGLSVVSRRLMAIALIFRCNVTLCNVQNC